MWQLLRLGWTGYLGEGQITGTSRTTPNGPVKPPTPRPPAGQGAGAAVTGGQGGGPAPAGDGANLRSLPDSPLDPVGPGFPGKPGAAPPGPPPRDEAGLQALEALIRSAGDADQTVRLGALESLRRTAASTGSADVLSRLAQLDLGQCRAVLVEVAGNQRTPENVLRNLAGTGDPVLAEAIAANRSAPPDLLDQLVRRPGADQDIIQELAAGNQRLLPQTFEYLAEQGPPRVRLLVAQNRGTPTELLEQMSRQAPPENQAQQIRDSEARIADLERRRGTVTPDSNYQLFTDLTTQIREERANLETLRTAPEISAAALQELARRAGGAGPTGGKR